MRTAILLLLITVLTFAAFDLITWNFVPPDKTGFLPLYRQPENIHGNQLPQHYFAAHKERGFDIIPGARGTHFVPDVGTYNVWSNDLGCYDEPFVAEKFRNGYIYLAGDSYTWGFIPYEDHFAEILRRRLPLPLLRCGVTNTGQRHQLSKFREITERTGLLPEIVIVTYIANDMADDYAYPQSTIVDGWMVPRVELDASDNLIPLSEGELHERVRRATTFPKRSAMARIKAALLRYSVSLNLLRSLMMMQKEPEQAIESDSHPTPDRRGFWQLYAGADQYPWKDRKLSTPNHQALLEWQMDARERGYQLVVAIPGNYDTTNIADYFKDMSNELRSEGFIVFDASTELAALPDPTALFHPRDGHFNQAGQKFYANFLEHSLFASGLLKE